VVLRLWPLSGIVFVVAFVAWSLLLGFVEPGGGQPRPSGGQVVDLLSDTMRQGGAHLVAAVASIALLAFSASIVALSFGTARGAGQGEARGAAGLPATAALAGVGLALVILATAGLFAGASDVIRRGRDIDPATATVVFDLAGGIYAFVPYLAATFGLTTSLIPHAVLGMPRGFRVAGVLISLATLAGAVSYDVLPGDPLWFVGIGAMLLWLAWVGALSVILVVDRGPAA
jgi:hypothetical protein